MLKSNYLRLSHSATEHFFHELLFFTCRKWKSILEKIFVISRQFEHRIDILSNYLHFQLVLFNCLLKLASWEYMKSSKHYVRLNICFLQHNKKMCIHLTQCRQRWINALLYFRPQHNSARCFMYEECHNRERQANIALNGIEIWSWMLSWFIRGELMWRRWLFSLFFAKNTFLWYVSEQQPANS